MASRCHVDSLKHETRRAHPPPLRAHTAAVWQDFEAWDREAAAGLAQVLDHDRDAVAAWGLGLYVTVTLCLSHFLGGFLRGATSRSSFVIASLSPDLRVVSGTTLMAAMTWPPAIL